MQSSFVKAICQVGTFMICAQAIVHFRPKASYEKYLKMLVSAMILIQLLVSFGGIFTVDGEKNWRCVRSGSQTVWMRVCRNQWKILFWREI